MWTYEGEPDFADGPRVGVDDLLALLHVLQQTAVEGQCVGTNARKNEERCAYGDVVQLSDALAERGGTRVERQAWYLVHLLAQCLKFH